MIFGLVVKMQIKQNGVWEFPPDGIQWKQNGVWETGVIEYVLATDDDFSGETDGSFRYIGTDEYVEIPHVIKGVNVTSYSNMFRETSVRGVVSTNKNVTRMNSMFSASQATSIDVSSFDTSSVTTMSWMFANSQATSLDLRSFDTSNVREMGSMFYRSQATILDLSSFDTSKVYDMGSAFRDSQTTIGYARIQADADKLNGSAFIPAGLTFVAKYVLATDDDFSGETNGSFRYIGTDDSVAIPHVIKGVNVTSYNSMFRDTSVRAVASNNKNVTDMDSMFRNSKATSLDLSSFNTSSVTRMDYMFYNSQATSLDLSSFDTSKVTNMSNMFYGSQATIGYARTQADADKFNGSSSKPAELTFIVKP